MDNRPVHLAAVYEDGDVRLYIDGRAAAEASKRTASNARLPAGLRLGDDTNPLAFHGVLREVRVSKVARYAKDFTPKQRFETDPDTLALYHCDEGEGDVLKDSSGNNHHGKIVGATWVKSEGTR